MADPLFVIAGILTIIQGVLQDALQTKQFINGIQGAPPVVQSLSKDLDALYVVLGVLRGHLDHAESNITFAILYLCCPLLLRIVSAFKTYLEDYQTICEDLWGGQRKPMAKIQMDLVPREGCWSLAQCLELG